MSRKPIILEDGSDKILRAKGYNKRLKIIMSVLTLLGVLVTSLYFYNIWDKENKAIESRMETFTELRHASLTRFVNSLSKETVLWANHASVTNEASRYFDIWRQMSSHDQVSLHNEFVGKQANDKSSVLYTAYLKHHGETHDMRQAFSRHHGYYDVFYFNLDGDLVYTVEKETDFGQNFVTGPLASSGLGKVFQAARESTAGVSVFYDFSPYGPSNDAPASFLASAMLNAKGEKIGVYAIQISVEKFDSVMQYSSGLGKSGETYVVGQDHMMRNNSRLSQTPTLLVRKIDNPAINIALNGKSALQDSKNESGNKTIVAALPLEISGVKWGGGNGDGIGRTPFSPKAVFMVLSFGSWLCL